MEVSSQGLMLHRTAGIPFEIGIFTNLGEDHIGPNEHKDFEDYKRCKGLLFKQCRIGIANVDDPYFEDVFRGATCQIETFGFAQKADLRAADTKLVSRPGYLGVSYHVSGLMDFDVEIDIPGTFSVYNSLTAIAVCRHFDVPVEMIKKALKVAKVKGRIEMVKVSEDFTLMIDYAHNAMSLESLLTTLKEYHPKRLVCLFGCGGNRAKARRYEMGEVSGKLADLTIITSDNPCLLYTSKAQWDNEKTSVERLQKIREEIEQVNQEIQKAQHSYNLERAAELQYGKLPQLTKQLEEEEKKVKERDLSLVHESVTDEEIARIISRWTGIPVAKLNESERSKTLHLDEELHKRVIGQDEGVTKVTEAIIRSKAGIKDPTKPIGSFLFLGPTGVGKTELAKALAESLFDDESNMVRIDMSEYMEKYSCLLYTSRCV